MNAGPPANLAPKTEPTMREQLREFHADCVAASIADPSDSTWFAGLGVNLVRWGTGSLALVDGVDPDSSILIVTGYDGASGVTGDDSEGYGDTDDSSLYVLAGDGHSTSTTSGGGRADAINDGTTTGAAWSFGGEGFGGGTNHGGAAYAECILGAAYAFGGTADSADGGEAEAYAFDKALAIGGDTQTGLGGAAYAYGALDGEAWGGEGLGANSKGGACEAYAPGGLTFAVGGDGSNEGGAALAQGGGDAYAKGGDTTGSGGLGGLADARSSAGDAEAEGGVSTGSNSTGGAAIADSINDSAFAYGGDGVATGGAADATGDDFVWAQGGDTTAASGTAGDAIATCTGGGAATANGGNCTGTTASLGGEAEAYATVAGFAFAYAGDGMTGGNARAEAYYDARAEGGFGLSGNSDGGDAFADTVAGSPYEAWATGGNGTGTGSGGMAFASGPNGVYYNLPPSGTTGGHQQAD